MKKWAEEDGTSWLESSRYWFGQTIESLFRAAVNKVPNDCQYHNFC